MSRPSSSPSSSFPRRVCERGGGGSGEEDGGEGGEEGRKEGKGFHQLH